MVLWLDTKSKFLSTPSRGGRYIFPPCNGQQLAISIHALTWRATSASAPPQPAAALFLPTPSHGGRPRQPQPCQRRSEFLPTPSHGGRREGRIGTGETQADFYPRPHMEGDVFGWKRRQRAGNFYPRPHMEGDSTTLFLPTKTTISTHALTWRAT